MDGLSGWWPEMAGRPPAFVRLDAAAHAGQYGGCSLQDGLRRVIPVYETARRPPKTPRMDTTWIIVALAAIAAVGGLLLMLRKSGTPQPRTPLTNRPIPVSKPVRRVPKVAPPVPVAPAGEPPTALQRDPSEPWEMPAALAALGQISGEGLEEDRRQAVLRQFKEVPRPPRLLTQLVSMDLMHAASSKELMALVSGEPLISVKVLGAVNSPAYGLSRTVSSIGQAVTFLGLNSVRAICMQYVLMQTFKADNPERARRLGAIWTASTLAGELTQYPAQRVGLTDGGGLTSAVVLTFLGSLAVTVGVPAGLLPKLPPRDAVARLQAEQTTLGLGAPQIGRVLMQHWDLPSSIIAEVDGLAQGLVHPLTHRGDHQGLRWAFGSLCMRLGERLAWGELDSIESFDIMADSSDELACVKTYLSDPTFVALVQALYSPHVTQRMASLLQGLRATTPMSPAARPAAALS
jgi:HD-like signal output (HDOD) protein